MGLVSKTVTQKTCHKRPKTLMENMKSMDGKKGVNQDNLREPRPGKTIKTEMVNCPKQTAKVTTFHIRNTM